jgi:hypothetical protein
VAPLDGLVGTGHHGEAQGRSGSTQTERQPRRQCLPMRHRTGWRRGWGRRRAVGGNAAARQPVRRMEESGERRPARREDTTAQRFTWAAARVTAAADSEMGCRGGA